MADPRTDPASLAAAGGVIAGVVGATADPTIGDYAVILFCAVAGAFVSVSKRESSPIMTDVVCMMRGVFIAGVFGWLASHYVAAQIDMPSKLVLGPVSFLIAFVGDDWFRVRSIVIDWLAARANRGHP